MTRRDRVLTNMVSAHTRRVPRSVNALCSNAREPSVASAQITGALPSVGKASPAPLYGAPLAPAKRQTAARLRVQPAHAVSVLNGRVLGSGDVHVPHGAADELHELRVSAPGYVTRVVLFRGAPQESSIVLAQEP